MRTERIFSLNNKGGGGTVVLSYVGYLVYNLNLNYIKIVIDGFKKIKILFFGLFSISKFWASGDVYQNTLL